MKKRLQTGGDKPPESQRMDRNRLPWGRAFPGEVDLAGKRRHKKVSGN